MCASSRVPNKTHNKLFWWKLKTTIQHWKSKSSEPGLMLDWSKTAWQWCWWIKFIDMLCLDHWYDCLLVIIYQGWMKLMGVVTSNWNWFFSVKACNGPFLISKFRNSPFTYSENFRISSHWDAWILPISACPFVACMHWHNVTHSSDENMARFGFQSMNVDRTITMSRMIARARFKYFGIPVCVHQFVSQDHDVRIILHIGTVFYVSRESVSKPETSY